MINLYVDDLRTCPVGFVLAKSYEEAILYLKKCEIGTLSLDHDLGIMNNKKELNGYDIVKYICNNKCNIKEIYLHTFNPIGRENMYKMLMNANEHNIININIHNYGYIETI